jgi:hypothetical protein
MSCVQIATASEQTTASTQMGRGQSYKLLMSEFDSHGADCGRRLTVNRLVVAQFMAVRFRSITPSDASNPCEVPIGSESVWHRATKGTDHPSRPARGAGIRNACNHLASVAQWKSTTMTRWGSRVRSPVDAPTSEIRVSRLGAPSGGVAQGQSTGGLVPIAQWKEP